MAAIQYGFETHATSTPDAASPAVGCVFSQADCFARLSPAVPLVKITDKALNEFHAVAIPHFLQGKDGKVCGKVTSKVWAPLYSTECNQKQSALINKVIFQTILGSQNYQYLQFIQGGLVGNVTSDLFALARNKHIILKPGAIPIFLEIMALAPGNAIFNIAEIEPHPGEKFKADDPNFVKLRELLGNEVIADKHITITI